MKALIENGVFRVPLYHGTSSIYVDSIERFGLGGVNPLLRYDAATLFKELLATCDVVFAGDPDWGACRFGAQWIKDQESFSDGANFQHGTTYLTPSRASAVGYALTNRLGSEFVTQTYRLYQLLTERRPEAIAERRLDEHPLACLFELDHNPVLVTARAVPVDAVASEGGGSPQASIDRLEALCDVVESGLVLNVNFRLRVPLSPGSFSVEAISPKESNPFEW